MKSIVSSILVIVLVLVAGYASGGDKTRSEKGITDIKVYRGEPEEGKRYKVIGPVQVTGMPQSTRGELLLMLKQQAAGMGADAVINIDVSSSRAGGHPGGTFCPDGSPTCVPVRPETYSQTTARGTAIKFRK